MKVLDPAVFGIRKDTILQFARHLFATKGYAETTMDDIAQAAKMQKASLYHYFPSKQQLLQEMMDMEVERNAYGRQLDSRIAKLHPQGMEGDLEAVFIRAPIIRRLGRDANVLASYEGDPVLVEQGRHLAATFHPELTDDSRVHLMFLGKIP